MIGIQECVGSPENLERFLNNDAIRLGWRIISVQNGLDYYLREIRK